MSLQGDAFALGMMIGDILSGFTYWQSVKDSPSFSDYETPFPIPDLVDEAIASKFEGLIKKNPLGRLSVSGFAKLLYCVPSKQCARLDIDLVHQKLWIFKDLGSSTSESNDFRLEIDLVNLTSNSMVIKNRPPTMDVLMEEQKQTTFENQKWWKKGIELMKDSTSMERILLGNLLSLSHWLTGFLWIYQMSSLSCKCNMLKI